MNIFEAIKQRRTHKIFDGNPISDEIIDQLLQYAMMAPNHRRNNPWRFTVVKNSSLEKFFQQLLPAFDEAYSPAQFAGNEKDRQDLISQKKAILQERLLKIGALIYVSCQINQNPLIHQENYAACSCAIENMMLAATGMGLGSFWNTGAIFATDSCMQLLSRSPQEEIFVGAIWLGKAADSPTPPIYENKSKIFYWENPQ